jgi:hypothetical protein
MGAMLAPSLHLGGVGMPVSLRHKGLSVVRIRRFSHMGAPLHCYTCAGGCQFSGVMGEGGAQMTLWGHG